MKSGGTSALSASEFIEVENRRSRKERLRFYAFAFVMFASFLWLAWTFAGPLGAIYAAVLDGILIVFAIYYFGVIAKMQRAGLRETPSDPWSIESREDHLMIRAGAYRVRLDIETISSAKLLYDNYQDPFYGMEDTTMTLIFQNGARLILPGSAEGFYEAKATLMSSGIPISEEDYSE